MTENTDLKGLKGWLVLVGIGVVIGPIHSLITYIPAYFQIFESGTWGALTGVNSPAYTPLWGELLIGEITFNTLMFFASLVLVYLYFSKRQSFPKFYILFCVVSLISVPVDAWLISKVFPDTQLFQFETVKEFIRMLVICSIWIPYMLVSKRVKATFIKSGHKK